MRPSETIINILLADKPRISIAFCPYKFAMWDCMEALYLECKRRGYVADLMPLYYYTLPDKQIHMEADAFKQCGYEVCDIGLLVNNSYDYIIIHYPYDGSNNVTKLLPGEYTDNLKRYGEVVYIPYHGNIAGPEWKRFYSMPGAISSDYIVLGSDLDVQVFKQANPMYRGTIIQVSDSPKTEAQLLHRGDEIPSEWKHINRPITLILGTLWTFTHDPIDRINKHKKIVMQEAECGHGIVYRPHPLVRNAIAVQRPEALQKYDEFIEELRELGVVVDFEPNLHRTIAVVDKIFIDPSSVIKSIEKYRTFEVIL